MGTTGFWLVIPIVAAIVLFFWGFRAYWAYKSRNWIELVGQIVEISASGGDADVLSAIVRYEYNGNVFTDKAIDQGDHDLRDKSAVGKNVLILVNPKNPTQIVLNNNGADFFNRSALMFAKSISKKAQQPGH